jgi:hypothetical protein
MKKSIFLVASVAMLALASCKKDYTCECSTTNPLGTTSSSLSINDTKKNAEEACDALNATVTNMGITQTTTCTLK